MSEFLSYEAQEYHLAQTTISLSWNTGTKVLKLELKCDEKMSIELTKFYSGRESVIILPFSFFTNR